MISVAADQGRPGREKLDGAAGRVPYPANSQRAGVVMAASGSGVIGRDQGGDALGPAGVVRLVRRPLRRPGVGAARDFGDPVRVKFAKPAPS